MNTRKTSRLTRICPDCGRRYTDPPAISRRDNTTEICPNCGAREAFEDFFGNLHIQDKEKRK